MKKRFFLFLILLLATLSAALVAAPKEAQAHRFSYTWFLSWGGFYNFAYPYPRYSSYYPYYYNPAIYYIPSAMRADIAQLEQLRALGEARKEIWLEYKKKPKPLIEAPVPPEPSLEPPDIKIETKKELKPQPM